MCCVCNGVCNHVGNHWYCNAHSAWLSPQRIYYTPTVMPATFTVKKPPYVGKHRKGHPEAGA